MKHISKYKKKGYQRFEYQPRYLDEKAEAMEYRKKEIANKVRAGMFDEDQESSRKQSEATRKRRSKRIRQSGVLFLFLYLVYHFGDRLFPGSELVNYIVYTLALFTCARLFIYLSRN